MQCTCQRCQTREKIKEIWKIANFTFLALKNVVKVNVECGQFNHKKLMHNKFQQKMPKIGQNMSEYMYMYAFYGLSFELCGISGDLFGRLGEYPKDS